MRYNEFIGHALVTIIFGSTAAVVMAAAASLIMWLL